jgi:hypothetical protein
MPATYRKYGSDEQKAKVYGHRVDLAEKAMKEWVDAGKKAWRRYEAEAQLAARTAQGHNVSGSTPVFVGNIDSQYSSLTSADIDFNVEPESDTPEEAAYVAGAALSQEFFATGAPDEGNAAIKDALLARVGWVKVGYEYYDEEQEVARPDNEVFAEVQRLVNEASEAGEEAPSPAQIAGLVPLTSPETVVLADRIVVDYVPFDQVLFDPTAKRLRDAQWVAQKQYMAEEDVKDSPLFREYTSRNRQSKKLKDLPSDTAVGKEVLGKQQPDKDDERFTVYTYYDFRTGTVCVFAKDADFLLYEGVNPFALNPRNDDKSPFVPVILRRTNSRIPGISETEVLKPTLDEIDIAESRLMTYLERGIPRVMAEEGSFTPAGKKALESTDILAVVELVTGKSPNESVGELKPAQLVQEFFNIPTRLENKVRESTGVSELQRGLFPDRKRTATETAEVVQASATRASEKRIALERFWLGVAQRILQLMMQFYEAPRVTRLADEVGDIPWDWKAEDIIGSYKLRVNLTPKESRSWQQRRDDALAVLNVVGPAAQPGPDGSSPADMVELLRYVLEEMGLPRRIIRRIMNLPEEQQQQVMANMQNQASMAQAAGGVSPNPAGVPGPMSAGALAAATNQGTLPPEVLAAAGGASPTGPEAVEAISESRGVTGF